MGSGIVKSSFKEGEVFLKDETSGEVKRLKWSTQETKRNRILPSGRYRLIGFRIKIGDWFISSTAGKKIISVTSKKAVDLKIPATIRVKLTAKRRQKHVRLFMTVAGYSGGGLSIYHKGKRISVDYVLEDSNGVELTKGTMRYG